MSDKINTNLKIYKSIAVDAHEVMCELICSSRKPKLDGDSGWIITLDPKQKSFKQAMITIVFTGIWLEAALHLAIVRNHSKEIFKKYDYKSYAEKLMLLGCSDKKILNLSERFQKCRKELVHEKAHFDSSEIKVAQDEADIAMQLLSDIDAFLATIR